MSSSKKRKLVQPETPTAEATAQHTIKLFEDLLHNVEQLCKPPGGRFVEQQDDGAVCLEVTRTESDGKITLTLESTHTKWRGLPEEEASTGARRQLETEINRREQDVKALHVDSEALRLRIEDSDYEQEHDLSRQLFQVHKTIGQHKQELQKLRSQSALEKEAEVEHEDRRLEITLSTLSRTCRQKAVVPPGNAQLYVFGGYGGCTGAPDGHDRLADTHCYNPRNNTWTRCASLMQARSSIAGAVLEGRLYAIGGMGPANAMTTTAESLDVRRQDKGWEAIARVPHETVGFSALPWGRSLYVLGGSCKGRYVPDVLRYDVVSNSWSKANSMSRARGYFGGVVLDGHAYVFGGIDSDYKVLDHAEKRDLKKYGCEWVAVAPLTIARWGCSSAVLQGKLYAIGGLAAGGRTLRSVERYDPALNVWHEVASMREAREDSCAAVLNGELYVLGGTSTDKEPLASVERYNEQQNEWYAVASMPFSITLAGCTVVE